MRRRWDSFSSPDGGENNKNRQNGARNVAREAGKILRFLRTHLERDSCLVNLIVFQDEIGLEVEQVNVLKKCFDGFCQVKTHK